MEKEFNLSDKTWTTRSGSEVNHIKDVKDFIRLLKEEPIELRDLGLTYEQGVAVWKRMNEFIDKHAGGKLK